MRSSRGIKHSVQPPGHDNSRELTTAWRGLNQTKAALRHIENRLEAVPGSGVLLDVVMDTKRSARGATRKVSCRDGRRADDLTQVGGASRWRRRSQSSPDKSSRSPLRNTTQDSNVCRNTCVDFKEPLASYREATPPSLSLSQSEAHSLQVGVSTAPLQPLPDPLSQLVYQSDTRDRQTDHDLESTRSSALDSTVVRYLNDRPALDALQTPTCSAKGGAEDPGPGLVQPPAPQADISASSSPGSASQRLENLRRRQPDDKLEKLKERIRRQREHLEEAAERERLLGYLERPVGLAGTTGTSSSTATVTVRKVAAAPPAPIYRGFNSSETKIRTPDGKVWGEEDFHNLSREIYRDLTQQLHTDARPQRQTQQKDRSRDRKSSKPVRKIHKSTLAPDQEAKPVISTTSWREGQKLVKMVLGAPKVPRDPPLQPPSLQPPSHQPPSLQPSNTLTEPSARSSSDPRSDSNRRSRPGSSERPRGHSRGRSHNQSRPLPPATPPLQSTAAPADQAPPPSGDLLSADIRGILDDLQLESKAAEYYGLEGVSTTKRRGGSGSRTTSRTSAWNGVAARGSRSASPAKQRAETTGATEPGVKKRHYDADQVRQYIARQQEERRRRLADERRAQREEAERRSQRLQELYRKQREGVARGGPGAPGSSAPVMAEAPVQKRLQETYSKLLLEQAELLEGTTGSGPGAPAALQRPVYQPSGESDKENKRQELALSVSSSSDMSLSEPAPPPLSRNDLGLGVSSWLQPDRLSPAVRGAGSMSSAPPADPFLSQLLGLEPAGARGRNAPPAALTTSRGKMSRIEALKATAASLSTRIESEARKLAGAGTSYGSATAMGADAILAPLPQDADEAGRWARAMSPPIREGNGGSAALEADQLALRIRKLLSAGQSAYNSDLTGLGDLHGYREKVGLPAANHTSASGHTPKGQEGWSLMNGLANMTTEGSGQKRGKERMEDGGEEEGGAGLHDSSGGSISEGPLLSEGSLSEADPSPPANRNAGGAVPRPADRLGALDFCSGQRDGLQPLLRFQREAESCPAFSSPLAPPPRDSRAPWEELAKGSPHSVINIFTKNHLLGHSTAFEDRPERTSPALHGDQSVGGSGDAAAYEDDFVLSRSSGASSQSKKGSSGRGASSHYEELMSRRSAGSTPNSSPLSRGSAPVSSPCSRGSAGKRGGASDRSDATLVDDPCSPPSETPSADARRRGSRRSSAHSQAQSPYSDSTPGGAVAQAPRSGSSKKSPGCSPHQSSASSPPGPRSPPGAGSPAVPQDSGSSSGRDGLGRGVGIGVGIGASLTSARGKVTSAVGSAAPAELQYAPGVLHQRLSAELTYLESIEESVRQLGDVERLRGVSLAQQESVSLAQILKAQQQRHERDLYELKIKAEREALETQLQLEENRQRAARAQVELQESMVQSQQGALSGLQEVTSKMASQQAEAARYTADAARHIREMTELARSQIAGALSVPAAPLSSLYEQQRQKLPAHTHTDSSRSEGSASRSRPEEALSSLDSLSHTDSLPSRRPDISGGGSSQPSPSQTSSSPRERSREGPQEGERGRGKDGASSSVEEEARTAADDSLPSDSIQSLLEEKDGVSVVTEYSLKFDESMTEDEIEERSFRSLLPSEAHRRGTLERKPRPQEESEEEAANRDKASETEGGPRQEGTGMPFSSGQHSFSRFTMEMVRQYMKEEEVRGRHQSSLLRLRQRALKEKTHTELAWLEHQKRRLRDKGEDDKMPPIRKRQRGLILKLQQEQIRRLQEANKAARKERQLLLKQQEDIDRMRQSTLRLRQRLQCAGDTSPLRDTSPLGETSPLETPVSQTPVEASSPPSVVLTDGYTRSPSPLSLSGSETSSIMQKLKKMRSHTDEKHCSPVHSFLSVLSAKHWASLSLCFPNLHPKLQLFISNQLVRFLTKREQQLLQRRRHAEELLEWKQRLDQEEAEVRRMEREALEAWDHHTPRGGEGEGSTPTAEGRAAAERGVVSGGESSPVPTDSSVHTEFSGSHPPSSPSCSTAPPGSGSTHNSPASYSQEFDSAPHSPHQRSPPAKVSPGSSALPEASRTRTQPPSPRTPSQAPPPDTPSIAQTEPMSDQSDIESRILALKEELRKRRAMVQQLKKEQKKRQKERLKAQEASLLRQLESYNNFIQKTEAELSCDPASLHTAKPQIKVPSASERARVTPPAPDRGTPAPPHRSETSQSWKAGSEVVQDSPHDDLTPLGRSRSTSLPEELSDEDPPTVTPTPVYGSPDHSNAQRDLVSPQTPSKPPSRDTQHLSEPTQKPSPELGERSVASSRRSEVLEELEAESSQQSTSEGLFKMNLEKRPASSKSDRQGDSLDDSRPKPGDSPDIDDVIKSGTSLANKTPSVATEPKGSDFLDAESSLSEHSFSAGPDEVSSQRELPASQDSPPSADGYHEDFESSVESSPREKDQRGSKPTSPSSPAHPGPRRSLEGSPTRSPRYSSSEDREKEISEAFSQHSDKSSDSLQSERMLDLQKPSRGSEEDTKEGVFSPRHSLSQTSPPPALDEMPSFSVGDRVLVSSIQPGTLRFKGQTQFANGFWAGVELDESEGSNNGTYDDVVYFLCQERHGIFAPPDKISHLPEKFEVSVETTTEEDDSFLDDLSDQEAKKRTADRKSKRGGAEDQKSRRASGDGDSAPADVRDAPVDQQNNLKSQKDKPSSMSAEMKEQGEHSILNGQSRDIILEFEDTPTTLYISDMDKIDWGRRSLKETTSLIESRGCEPQLKSSSSEAKVRDGDALSFFADKLINTFIRDAVKQLTQIRKAKEEKISTANQEQAVPAQAGDQTNSSDTQRDGLPFFLDSEQEEVSSPELGNRTESPVLGPSGQEELARRLAELELSRELLDELGDEQDWFDEDFGLSTRREQQRQKQREEEEQEEAAAAVQGGAGPGRAVLGGLGETVPVKTPPRPELPLPPKLPEQPAMVVPHTALQVEKLVHAATQEIWNSCGLSSGGTATLTGRSIPKPSDTFLGHDAKGQGQDQVAIRSYRQAVFDLTWEIIQEIYAEDPNTNQPLWMKPRRVNSSSFHRVKSPGNLNNVQEFISTEVLKLYGLKKDKNQKMDWQKMLKFGRKKRDRVDHVLVQELHEEEAQWVSYDEDELFVKMQLADGIFDALIKDTAEVFSQIQDKRSRQNWLS